MRASAEALLVVGSVLARSKLRITLHRVGHDCRRIERSETSDLKFTTRQVRLRDV